VGADTPLGTWEQLRKLVQNLNRDFAPPELRTVTAKLSPPTAGATGNNVTIEFVDPEDTDLTRGIQNYLLHFSKKMVHLAGSITM
jgi:hypothetical protein